MSIAVMKRGKWNINIWYDFYTKLVNIFSCIFTFNDKLDLIRSLFLSSWLIKFLSVNHKIWHNRRVPGASLLIIHAQPWVEPHTFFCMAAAQRFLVPSRSQEWWAASGIYLVTIWPLKLENQQTLNSNRKLYFSSSHGSISLN